MSNVQSEGVEIVKLDEEHTLKPHEEEIVDMRFSDNNPDTDNLEPKSRGKSELKRAATSQSVLFEFGDDESNNKKLLATGNQYFFPEFEVACTS